MRTKTSNILLAATLAVSVSACSPNFASRVQTGIRAFMAPTTPEGATFGVTAPAGTVEASIQDVILRGNQQQEEALTARDPTLMRDTSTDGHFQDMVDINQSMLDAGITAIRLLNLEWGDIAVGGLTATATTWETWSTTFPRGGSSQSRDRNVYLLVQQDGLWKIESNDHPDDAVATPPGSAIDEPAPAIDRDRPSAVTRGRSSNWSGYAAVGGTFTGVSGTWTVPEPKADGTMGASATWVGIGGERSRDLIQAGTEETVLSSGRIRYSAWMEMLPAPSRPVPLPVKAGDSVTVSINQRERGTWSIAFVNHSTGGAYDRTVQYSSSYSSVEWVEEAPSMTRGGLLPLGNFGTIRFSDGTTVKNGKTMSIAEANGAPIVMTNRRDEPLASPSVLDATGAGFTVKREAAAPITGGPPSRRRGG